MKYTKPFTDISSAVNSHESLCHTLLRKQLFTRLNFYGTFFFDVATDDIFAYFLRRPLSLLHNLKAVTKYSIQYLFCVRQYQTHQISRL